MVCLETNKETPSIDDRIRTNDDEESPMTYFERAAKRGAKYLDKNFPDWYKKIKMTILNQANCDYCILGQLYGEFEGGLIRLDMGWNDDTIYTHGFDVPGLVSVDVIKKNYKELAEARKDEIRARRAK